jgi:hypothetical protein
MRIFYIGAAAAFIAMWLSSCGCQFQGSADIIFEPGDSLKALGYESE